MDDKEKFVSIGVGFSLAFALFLIIGVLDRYKYLDTILDFLHIP